jgi:hypothetical protein
VFIDPGSDTTVGIEELSTLTGGAAITSTGFSLLTVDFLFLIARQEGDSRLLPVGAFSVDVRHDQLERQLKAV